MISSYFIPNHIYSSERTILHIRKQNISFLISLSKSKNGKFLDSHVRFFNHIGEFIKKYNENKSAKDMIKEELPYLIKLIPTYDISRVVELRVNKYSVVTIDENKYSVPDSLVGKFVTAKIYPQNILIYHENKKQARTQEALYLILGI